MKMSKKILFPILIMQFSSAGLLNTEGDQISEPLECFSECEYEFDTDSEKESDQEEEVKKSRPSVFSQLITEQELYSTRLESRKIFEVPDLLKGIEALVADTFEGEEKSNKISSEKDPIKKWNKLMELLTYEEKENIFSNLKENSKYSDLKDFLQMNDLMALYSIESARFRSFGKEIPKTKGVMNTVILNTEKGDILITQAFLNDPQNWQDLNGFEIAKLETIYKISDCLINAVRDKSHNGNDYDVLFSYTFESLIRAPLKQESGEDLYEFIKNFYDETQKNDSLAAIDERERLINEYLSHFDNEKHLGYLKDNLERIAQLFKDEVQSKENLESLSAIYLAFEEFSQLGNMTLYKIRQYRSIKKIISEIIVKYLFDKKKKEIFEYFIHNGRFPAKISSSIDVEIKETTDKSNNYGISMIVNYSLNKSGSPNDEFFIDAKSLTEVFLSINPVISKKEGGKTIKISKKDQKINIEFIGCNICQYF